VAIKMRVMKNKKAVLFTIISIILLSVVIYGLTIETETRL